MTQYLITLVDTSYKLLNLALTFELYLKDGPTMFSGVFCQPLRQLTTNSFLKKTQCSLPLSIHSFKLNLSIQIAMVSRIKHFIETQTYLFEMEV
jgi:hypothetical protein